MYLSPNAQKKARFAIAGGGAERKAYATAPIAADGESITHLAVVIDGGTDSAYFYINGIQKGSVKRVPSLSTFEDTANFIGKPLAPASRRSMAIFIKSYPRQTSAARKSTEEYAIRARHVVRPRYQSFSSR